MSNYITFQTNNNVIIRIQRRKLSDIPLEITRGKNGKEYLHIYGQVFLLKQ